MRHKRRPKKGKRDKFFQNGFTLVEVLVSLGIMAALVTIVTPIVINFVDEARINAANLSAKALKNAIAAINTAELSSGGGFYEVCITHETPSYSKYGYWFIIRKDATIAEADSGLAGFSITVSVNNDSIPTRSLADIFHSPSKQTGERLEAAFSEVPEKGFAIFYVDKHAVLRKVFTFFDDPLGNAFEIIAKDVNDYSCGFLGDESNWSDNVIDLDKSSSTSYFAFAGKACS